MNCSFKLDWRLWNQGVTHLHCFKDSKYNNIFFMCAHMAPNPYFHFVIKCAWWVISKCAYIIRHETMYTFQSVQSEFLYMLSTNRWIVTIKKFGLSEISGSPTFISNGFIWSRQCPILMVDRALNRLDFEHDYASFLAWKVRERDLFDTQKGHTFVIVQIQRFI